jgi:hypothetical protein
VGPVIARLDTPEVFTGQLILLLGPDKIFMRERKSRMLRACCNVKGLRQS